MPENEPDSLDNLLRQKFEQFGSEPSDKVWENIATAVEKENRRKRRYLLWISLAALMVVLSGAGAYVWLKNRSSESLQAGNPTSVPLQTAPAGAADVTSTAADSDASAIAARNNDPENLSETVKPGTTLADTKAGTTEAGSAAATTTSKANTAASSASASSARSETGTSIASRSAAAPVASPEKGIARADKRTGTKKSKVYQKSAAGITASANRRAATGNEPGTGVPQETNDASGKSAPEPAPATTTKQNARTVKTEPVAAISAKEESPEIKPDRIKKSTPETPVSKAFAPEAGSKTEDKAGKTAATTSDPDKASETETTAAPVKTELATKTGTTPVPVKTEPAAETPASPEKQTADIEPAAPAAAATEGTEATPEKKAVQEPEKDKLEEETGIWAQDTTGLSVTPPKDTTEVPPPHAIPVRAVEIFGSPEYGFRSLSGGQNPGFTNTRNQYESAGLGFSGGVNMTFGVTKKLGIKTGLQYTELREKLDYPAGFLSKSATYSSYKFITLPLYLVYEKRGYSNFTVEFSAGPNLNMFVGGQNVVLNTDNTYELKKWGDTGHPFRTYNLSATAGVGLNYRLNKLISLMLRPTVTYFPWSVTEENHPEHKPYSVGAQTGIRIGF